MKNAEKIGFLILMVNKFKGLAEESKLYGLWKSSSFSIFVCTSLVLDRL